MASNKNPNLLTNSPNLSNFINKWNKKKNPHSRKASIPIYTDVEACIIIQKVWRMYIYRSKIITFHKRSHPARELLSTETTFVNILKCMVHLFLKPIKEQNILPDDDIRAIFSNVESILMLNNTLWIETMERMKDWGFNGCIGDIFLKITDFFKVYIDYVTNYETALSTLTERKKSSGSFRKFLKVQQRKCKGHEYESLESFLITPVQRIPRYNLLLNELVKSTPSTHPDYNNLVAALEKVQDTARYVNERAQEAEKMSKIYALHSSLSGSMDADLLSPDRVIIDEGSLIQIHKMKMRNVHCILFNDLLLLHKENKNGKGRSRVSMKRSNTQKDFVCRFSLTKAKLIELATSIHVDCEHTFYMSNEETRVTIGSNSKEEYEKWKSLIKKQINDINEKEQFYNEQKELVSKQKAAEARTLIHETYARNRIQGSNSGDIEDKNTSGMRKFARKKQALSLTPSEKLEFIKQKEIQTTELLQEESKKNAERDEASRKRADSFKLAAANKYKPTNTVEDNQSNTKLRKFASLKRKPITHSNQ